MIIRTLQVNRKFGFAYYVVFFCVACSSAMITLKAYGQGLNSALAVDKIKQVLFLGNSITYAGTYVNMFETYYIAQFPKHHLEVINEGLPSETVSGLSEPNHADGRFPRPCLFTRLDSVLKKTDADVVFACYGMNDGIYLPWNQQRFEAYKRGMIRLHQALEVAGIKRIIFLTPPVHDDAIKGLGGYNKVLDRYAIWLLEQRRERNWEVADLHFPMKQYLIQRRRTEPDFKLADDGVHPGELGHWLMTKAILQYLDNLKHSSLNSLQDYLRTQSFLPKLYEVVSKRQTTMKDAWLTYTGHNRPGMTVGMPMSEAQKHYDEWERVIDDLLAQP